MGLRGTLVLRRLVHQLATIYRQRAVDRGSEGVAERGILENRYLVLSG